MGLAGRAGADRGVEKLIRVDHRSEAAERFVYLSEKNIDVLHGQFGFVAIEVVVGVDRDMAELPQIVGCPEETLIEDRRSRAFDRMSGSKEQQGVRIRAFRNSFVDEGKQALEACFEGCVTALHGMQQGHLVVVIRRRTRLESPRSKQADRQFVMPPSRREITGDVAPKRRHHRRTMPSRSAAAVNAADT